MRSWPQWSLPITRTGEWYAYKTALTGKTESNWVTSYYSLGRQAIFHQVSMQSRRQARVERGAWGRGWSMQSRRQVKGWSEVREEGPYLCSPGRPPLGGPLAHRRKNLQLYIYGWASEPCAVLGVIFGGQFSNLASYNVHIYISSITYICMYMCVCIDMIV